MPPQRQQCFLLAGAALLLAAGLLALLAWQFTGKNVAVRLFESQVRKVLMYAAMVFVALGVIGGIMASCWNCCVLCCFAWAALLLSIASAAAGAWLPLRAEASAARLESLCLALRAGEEAALPAPAAAAQGTYDDGEAALRRCRRDYPSALGLESCTGSGGEGAVEDFLLRWAEDSFVCGGFCVDGMPLFALPQGTVNVTNMNETRTACFMPVAEELRRSSGFLRAVFLLGALAPLPPLLGACWLACAPPPRLRPGWLPPPAAPRPHGEHKWSLLPQQDEESVASASDDDGSLESED